VWRSIAGKTVDQELLEQLHDIGRPIALFTQEGVQHGGLRPHVGGIDDMVGDFVCGEAEKNGGPPRPEAHTEKADLARRLDADGLLP
jgi:hypothetical protein